jgi:MerR family transcriptional regulator, heat shock protein HspR
MARRRNEPNALYVISIAAELAGVHPQTLRVYERKGLVQPHRTEGNTRRYSEEDIVRLRKIQELTQEGINLAGVIRILELELQVEELRRAYDNAMGAVEDARAEVERVVGSRNAAALVPFKDVRRIRRAMKSDEVDRAGRRRTFPSPPVS